MVSFSCEACGDVLTKKKLDSHRNQCRDASFTCLDCMVHFWGTEYRAHTSCISEAQKYQGALYRPEKEKKGKGETSQAIVPRKAYVEDVPEDYTDDIAIVDSLPPEAPSPPAAAPGFGSQVAEPVNVFDFLVGKETPNQSTLAFTANEQEQMLEDVPEEPKEDDDDDEYYDVDDDDDDDDDGRFYEDEQAQGMLVQYGSGPVATTVYQTPAPKAEREKKKHRDRDAKKDEKKDKKRKRLHLDTLKDGDEVMTDAPPVLHSGLTGGLGRLLSRPSVFPPSPDYSGGDAGEASPASPIKRSKHSKRVRDSRSEGIGNTIMSLITTRNLNKDTDDDARPRKHRHRRQREDTERARGRMIEYKPINGHAGDDGSKQLMLRQDRACQFLSLVNKGPESERGASVRKTLKRYLRERAGKTHPGKAEEERELWRALRVKKNDRGEVVLFF
ncbi:MAG: hypothetical protein M1818_002232 [Claussenomyces sp. TS43310]|nr:MAG: hypothetical protein M1818_002232 [Claussenomyces sp. TS43310]